MDLSRLSEWLKLSPRYLLPISLVTGFMLFASSDTLNTFGLNQFVGQYRPYLGIVFLISAVLLLVNWSINGYERSKNKWHQTTRRKAAQKRLHRLTPPEKRILNGFIGHETRSQYLSIESGIVNGLEAEGIIYRASAIGRLDEWAYNIQPWAWEELNKNPDLLEPVLSERAAAIEAELQRRGIRH